MINHVTLKNEGTEDTKEMTDTKILVESYLIGLEDYWS